MYQLRLESSVTNRPPVTTLPPTTSVRCQRRPWCPEAAATTLLDRTANASSAACEARTSIRDTPPTTRSAAAGAKKDDDLPMTGALLLVPDDRKRLSVKETCQLTNVVRTGSP